MSTITIINRAGKKIDREFHSSLIPDTSDEIIATMQNSSASMQGEIIFNHLDFII
jgi:hypothetical protein